MKAKTIVIAHYLIVVLVLSLPFWLSWKLILTGAVIYHLLFIKWIGYCPLTVWQFGSAEEGFVEKHLKVAFNLINFRPKTKNLKTFISYGIPMLLVIVALLWQSL